MLELKEALGVPENIVNLGIEISEKINDKIPENLPADTLDGQKLVLTDRYKVGKVEFTKIEVMFDIIQNDEENSDVDIIAFGIPNKGELTSNLKIKQIETDTLEILIKLLVGKNTTTNDIQDYLFTVHKKKVISSLTHELKHFYDGKVKPYEKIASRAKYHASAERGFRNITPLNNFLLKLYFIHNVENLVRPTEIASLIETGNVTKKEFYDFFMNQEVVKVLYNIKNFKYEKLREELVEYLPKIEKLLDDVNVDYSGLNEQQIIDKILELFYINFVNWQAEFVRNALITSPLEEIFGFSGQKGIYWDNFIKKIAKYRTSPEKFFLNEEKNMKIIANNVLKKIAKLYDMTKDLKTESIINWEKWYDLVSKKTIVERTFKFNI